MASIDIVPNSADVLREYLQLIEKYPNLFLYKTEDTYRVEGNILVKAQFKGVEQLLDYEIEIHIPADYPLTIPSCYEKGGRITHGYHMYEGGRLCLGVDSAQYQVFRRNQSLIGFVDDLVIPYLYGYEYTRRYKKSVPWSEERHGVIGLIDYYGRFFGADLSMIQIIRFLLLACSDVNLILPSVLCCCDSGRHIRHCHTKQVQELRKLKIKATLIHDIACLAHYSFCNNKDLPKYQVTQLELLLRALGVDRSDPKTLH